MTSRIYSLPPGISFVDALATHLLARWPDPLALTQAQIFLPNRRSARALREAFLRQSDGQPLLLPRMLPLGEMDADELALVSGTVVPAALPPERRQILLARLIKTHQPALPMPQVLALAQALGRLMDEAAEEAVDLDKLHSLAPADLAEHWQTTLSFLQPVLQGWPLVLQAQGHMDNAERRNVLLRAQAAHWRESPPAHPVIIAGSTSVLPALVELKQAALGLPQGEIILPGLPPLTETTAYWADLDVAHPLAEVKELLEKLNIAPSEVQEWPLQNAPDAAPRRLWQTAFLPAAATPQWMQREAEILQQGANNLSLAVCATPEEEATVIALRLRAVAQEAGRTGMLVTPDRGLARRVIEICRRWNINLADSGGTPLPGTVPAIYLRLLARAAFTGSDVDLLMLLKHPLAAGGLNPARCRDYARTFEQYFIRQTDPHPSWPEHPAFAWLQDVKAMLAPFSTLLAKGEVALSELLRAHLHAAEALAKSDSEEGAARLWKGEAGESLGEQLARLLEAATPLPPLASAEYEETLVVLLQNTVVRPRYGQHPRLHVLGALEAELMAADVVILGGLNEAVWPASPKPDPWLSRTMRHEIGLQDPERSIGREAHDFMQLASHSEVMLTRAVRLDGAPTVASRWWQRLQAVLDLTPALQRGQHYLNWAQELDKAAEWKPFPRPAPNPPLAARPRELSVTRIEMWRRDPYALYAYKILRLEKLGELEPMADVADKGNFLHKVLERFLNEHPQGNAAQLLAIAEAVFAERGWGLVEKRLWWPRLEQLATWFVRTQAERDSQPLLIEVQGETTLTLDSGLKFTLTARADRIDRAADGTLVVLDYKSGTIPDKKDQELGYSPQLPVTGLLIESGGFGAAYKHAVSDLEFWKLATKEGGTVERYKVDVRTAIDEARDGLLKLIAAYDDPARPYRARPLAAHALRYNDYSHLERIKEWSVAGAEEEE